MGCQEISTSVAETVIAEAPTGASCGSGWWEKTQLVEHLCYVRNCMRFKQKRKRFWGEAAPRGSGNLVWAASLTTLAFLLWNISKTCFQNWSLSIGWEIFSDYSATLWKLDFWMSPDFPSLLSGSFLGTKMLKHGVYIKRSWKPAPCFFVYFHFQSSSMCLEQAA